MARILIDMNEVIVRELMDLVRRGLYKDLDQIVEVAAANQLKLERTTTGLMTEPAGGRKKRSTVGKKGKTDLSQVEQENHQGVYDFNNSLLQEPSGKRKTIAAPNIVDLLFPNYSKLEDIFTWGQYNRILPVKVGIRILDNMLSKSPELLDGSEVVDLEGYFRRAAPLAREIGLYMKTLDDARARKRAVKFSNGLPIGQDESKSTSRYINHFLAKKRRKDNVLDGFEARLKMVNIKQKQGGKYYIGITAEGLEFSRINNTFLLGQESDWPLSPDEIDFYLKHIVKSVPEERSTLHEILTVIMGGNSKVSKIDERLAAEHQEWTGPMVITNRAGTLSRLWELRLIEKSGNGESEIDVTDSGSSFIHHLNTVN
jgi:hypothetical protein